MNIKIVENTISIRELKELAHEFYGEMIKGVVDIEKEVVAFGGEYHIDAKNVLCESGSEQQNIWGFNLYFDQPKELWITCTSFINIRPQAGNKSVEVEDPTLCDKMKRIVNSKIV